MANKDEKQKLTTKTTSYFKGVRSELKKVNWPTRKELTNYTIVVLSTTLALTIIIWGLDLVFKGLLSAIV
ncbi:MAG: preprotein translocase subunit SecE [Tissierellia bacterium]|jgi:preprotein translocase subunit SecE|nr:preprotein translocase subunit SecE [Tissierellia bacterium]MDD3751895.1 preprotein translocase subunit SecE [Tissierellia bacterium]MDD4046685.1 preprotein translocase subunit SecE [Tissierellia bacterium]